MTLLAAPRRERHIGGLLSRAPKHRVSPERIAASLTLIALVALGIAALVQSGFSLTGVLSSWGNAQRFMTRVG